jgi:alpha-tubulin suppressor-like RCC1 family protein
MAFLTAKFGTLSSFGLKFFLGLFVSFLLVGCGDESKVAVVAQDSYSFAIDSNGEVYATGYNLYGQLGLGDAVQLNNNCGIRIVGDDIFYQFFPYCKAFTKVSSLDGKNITAISGGKDHSIALDVNGKVYAAGENYNGQLGFEDTSLIHRKFAAVPSLNGKNIIGIAAGYSHSLALDSNGKVYAAGSNHGGQLGLGDSGSGTDRSTFTEVSSLKDKNITTITARTFHSLALGSDGRVYIAGRNSIGLLWYYDSFTEVLSLSGKKITAIATGDDHSFVLDSNGKVYAMGYNEYGQLGMGDTNDRNTFTEVSSLNDKNITAIIAGTYHSFAIDSNNKVYATGYNSGQLGMGDTNNRNTFTEVSSLKGKNITAITAGDWHSFAIDSNGKVYAAGSNDYGQLGLGDMKDRKVFTEVKD